MIDIGSFSETPFETMSYSVEEKLNPKSVFSSRDATDQQVLSKMCFDSSSLAKLNSPSKVSLSTSSSPSLSKSSRHGRELQRWDGGTRLVTGTVPITKHGEIILCSAARKPEWIFPKGGWDLDETLEDGAKRESYEEAGVLGELGPSLEPVTYETGKSKKQRLKALAKENNQNGDSTDQEMCSMGDSNRASDLTCNSSIVSYDCHTYDQFPILEQVPNYSSCTGSIASSGDDEESPHVDMKIDESIKNDIQNKKLCTMRLFPLYVSEVLESWPESGRMRKVMSIDDALKEVTRPEMKACLMEIKEKGLHLPSS
mmetsp:Transcript_15788/g.35565  ORF Transcript_15788/g.35565 Transcript_15788/m.35565 type:complete len:313 (-) Transcript_15788:288-1226(-)